MKPPQMIIKLLVNDNNITGDNKSSNSLVIDAKWLYVSLDSCQKVLGRIYKN